MSHGFPAPAVGWGFAPGAPDRHVHPEAEFLLACVRPGHDAEATDRTRALLSEDLDWERLVRLAQQHAVLPLLFWHLRAVGPNAVPADTLACLRARFAENARWNVYLTAELIEVLQLLQSHGVPAIAYKGPVLAAVAFGNLALRQFRDLDLLVRQADVPKARDLLVARGYQPRFDIRGAREAAFLRYQCEHIFLHPRDDVMIEIHWRIAERYFLPEFDVEGLWERARPIELSGREILTCSPEDLLLILCLHGAKHHWYQLSLIGDLAHLVETHPDLRWDRARARARARGGERMLLTGLSLATSLLGARLPLEVAPALEADRAVHSLTAWIQARLFQDVARPLGVREGCSLHLRMKERLRDQVRYCLDLALTPTVDDWQFLPLPEVLSPLYYPLRPIRLLRQHVLTRRSERPK